MKTGSGIVRALTLASVAMALTMGMGALPQVAGAVGPEAAELAAVQALQAENPAARSVIFSSARVLAAGEAVRFAPLAGDEADAAGMASAPLPLALRAPGGEAAWLFYEDRAPNALYEHGGRVALVGVRSGEVLVSSVISGPPVVGGQPARFLGSSQLAFRTPPKNPFGKPGLPPVAPPQPSTSPARLRAAAQLGAQRVCFVRIAGTLGNFSPLAAVSRSGAAFARLTGSLSRLAPGIVAGSYRAGAVTPSSYVQSLIDGNGCREASLYVAGGGFQADGEAAIAIGTWVAGNRAQTQSLKATDLRALLRSRPGVQWDLTLDAPGAGAILAALREEPNLASAQASGRAGEPAFVATTPAAASKRLLRFTRGLLGGLSATLDDDAAVAAAISAADGGRAPSLLAALLSRGFERGIATRAFARLGVEPLAYLRAKASTGLGAGSGGSSSPAVPIDPGGLTPPNSPPLVVSGGASVAYTENDPAVVVDPSLTVNDSDSATLSGASVRVASGYAAGEDVLDFIDQNGIAGSWDAGSGVLTLSGSTSVSAYQAALRSVAYRNLSDGPAPGPREIAFRVSDGKDESNVAPVTVEVSVANDAPDVQLAGGSASYTENAAATPVDATLTVVDPDSATITSATVAIGTGLASGEDVLELITPVTGISASYDQPTGTLTLTGPASRADFEAALRAVGYRNSSEDPNTAVRAISFVLTDAEGDAGPTRSRDLAVTAVNNAPEIATTASALAYSENDPATAVDSGLTLEDSDSAQLAGATVTVASGYVNGADELGFVDAAGIVGSWNAADGVLTLSGSASVSAYQSALRSVTYRNLSDDPAASPRTVAFRADDGGGLGAAATRTVELTPANDAPELTLPATGALAYGEGDPATPVDPGAVLTDPDSTQVGSATASVSAGLQSGEDALSLATPVAGIVALYDAGSGVLTLTGPAPVADFQAALRAVAYANDSEDPSTATRTISFVVTDAEGDAGATQSRDVSVAAVNDAPLAADDDAGSTNEATALTIPAPGVLGNDSDADDALAVVAVEGQPASVGTTLVTGKGASVEVDADGSLSYDPSGAQALRDLDEDESTTDTFTYAAGDGSASSTATVTVTVTGLSAAPEAGDDSYAGVGNTTLAVGQGGPSGQAFKQLSGSVLDNDTDPDTPKAGLGVEAKTAATTLGGSVTIAVDGKFTYSPPAGTSGSSDSFTYAVSDGKQTDTGTVQISLAGRVWYVDNAAAAGGTGVSAKPLDTLAAASAASSAGDTIYVFRGDGASTGQNAGIALKANQRLVGQAVDLVVGGDTLFDGTGTQRPKIGNGAGVGIGLASGSRVEGIEVAASGGAAISGGAGVAGSTIADVVASGSAGGIALNGTSGTFAISDLALTTSGGVGLLATNAGTVQLAEAGTISLAVTGAKALEASGTALSGAIDSLSVSSSATGGVSLLNTTGSLAFGGLTITTSGGTGFLANNATGLSIPAAGTANVASTGGPAVDVRSSSSPALAFDSASSTNSSGTGFNVDTVSGGSVTASGGTIAGAAGAAVDVNAGSGTVSYGGAITDGSGRPAEVTGRTGGAVTISGNISEDDTGISVASNSGGSTEFSGASKSISTGAGNAVSLTNNSGHTVSFSGGGLALTTTSGKGFAATGGGTVNVTGTANTVASTTGTALEVQNTTIGASDLVFRSVAANGGANGIVLNTTGSSGGLTVTGNGSADSGGVIQNTVGADGSTAGVGAYLNSTSDVSLSRMRFTTQQGHAIRGSGVNGFALLDSTVNGTNGTNDGFDEGSVSLTGLTGTAAITDTTIQGGYEDNLDIYPTSGTLNLTMTRLTVGANSTALGGNGVLLLASGNANVTTTVSESDFTSSREDLFQHVVQDQAKSNFTFDGNELSNNHPSKVSGGSGILVQSGGSENAELTYRITNNKVRDANGVGIFVQKATGISKAQGRIANNQVGATGVAGSGSFAGIAVEARGQGSHTTAITGNVVRRYSQGGIEAIAGEDGATDNGTVSFDVNVVNNTVTEPDGSKVSAGFRGEVADPLSKVTFCLDLKENALAGSANFGTDVRVFNDWSQTVFRLPGYAGGALDGTAVGNYFAGRNTLTTKLATAPSSGGYSSTAACAQPPA